MPTRLNALSFRKLLFVYAGMLAAVALLMNRSALPPWAKIEFLGYRSLSAANAKTLQSLERGKVISLRGSPTLVVGDSQVEHWPWSTDRVCFHGWSAAALDNLLAVSLGDRHYAQIVLWPGTAELAFGGSLEAYANGVVRLVGLAREHTDLVIVVGPMPYDAADAAKLRANLTEVARLAGRPDPEAAAADLLDETETLVPRAVALVRARLPDVPVYDLSEFRAAAIKDGLRARYWGDALHLNPTGLRALGHELAALGFTQPDSLQAETDRAEAAGAEATIGTAPAIPKRDEAAPD